MARTSLGSWKFVRDMGSSSHCGLVMAPGQEANSDNLGKSFRFATQFHDKNEKISLYICFLSCRKKIRRDSKNEFELTMVNEPSVFELTRFDCISFYILLKCQPVNRSSL